MRETITTSLLLSRDMGVKNFELRMDDGCAVPLILANKLLHGAERFHLQIWPNYDDDDIPTTKGEFSNIQELCQEHLRKAVGCHVAFLLLVPYAVFSCDDIIDRFLAASRSEDFSMPRSIRMNFGNDFYTRKPTNRKHPTHREVEISRKVLPRHYSEKSFKCDAYHFRNQTTDEWLTVCLGKYRLWDDGGRIDFVFLQKGRIMASVEDIDRIKPFP
ncbi:hypothetical protein AAVH_09675 [Aphelenchoides avenae]|nr:hypothetical protein AAVH_09675 [Aphelenchus avenae]